MKILLALLLLIIGTNLSFGNHHKEVQSKVKNVAVFLNGVQVFKYSKINIF
jgi:hypothetical protein